MIMEDVRSLIASVNQKFMDAFSRLDAAGVAALYTEDTKLLPPGFPMMTGKEAVKSFWQGAMNSGVTEAKLETLELESQGNSASEIGRFTLTVQLQGNETTTMTGKYVVVWKNQDGDWKLHIDIWNTDES
jgi:uncharacterized protein (TIGR02246 family)